ncbi:hypothetical protein CMV_008941 [Castanea mollissima]|uniref:RING-type E3 ubiquitin transferase n=1 Tax=Castanea mollissima TaxID=60419 RepID=A0A8J4RF74_9ROSI|nr:hypothetical protein CMV_008941 [Castanea mollissima]
MASTTTLNSNPYNNQDVYIRASLIPLPRDNESHININYKVITNCLSDAEFARNQTYTSEQPFDPISLPCDLLISERSNNPSWNIISRMISDMKISSQRLHWREQEQGEGVVSLRNTLRKIPGAATVSSSSMPVPWKVLKDVDDLIKHILDFAQSLVKKNNNKKQVVMGMMLLITKEVTLPHHEFEWSRNKLEQTQRYFGMFRYMLREEARRGSRPIDLDSLWLLEEVIFKDTDDGLVSEPTCAVCLENFLIGSNVTTMPCSHIFHTKCILKWLARNHVCPLCRFELPKLKAIGRA